MNIEEAISEFEKKYDKICAEFVENLKGAVLGEIKKMLGTLKGKEVVFYFYLNKEFREVLVNGRRCRKLNKILKKAERESIRYCCVPLIFYMWEDIEKLLREGGVNVSTTIMIPLGPFSIFIGKGGEGQDDRRVPSRETEGSNEENKK